MLCLLAVSLRTYKEAVYLLRFQRDVSLAHTALRYKCTLSVATFTSERMVTVCFAVLRTSQRYLGHLEQVS